MNDAIQSDALALHRGLLTLDTHIDIPWPTGPDPFQDGTRRVPQSRSPRKPRTPSPCRPMSICIRW